MVRFWSSLYLCLSVSKRFYVHIDGIISLECFVRMQPVWLFSLHFLSVSNVHFSGAELLLGCSSSGLFQFYLCYWGRRIAGGWRAKWGPSERTLALLKGLFKVLGGLTLGEMEQVWNGKALQFCGFIITGSTTGCTEIGEVRVFAHSSYKDVLGALV